jgi:GntR family transcriptional regulator
LPVPGCPASGGTVISVPTPHPERPLYRLVADELRRRIHAGALPPGSLLPAESALIAEFRTSRGTIREAIRLLREEGLVVTEHGRGSYVRPVLPVRRLGSDRYRREVDQVRGDLPPMTSFTADRQLTWSDYHLDRAFREVSASAAVAELFDVEPGTELLERRFVFHAAGTPQQLSTSYYLLALVAGTPVADPANEPWPGGNTAQLCSLGIEITAVRERVKARMPLPDEADALRMAAGVPVVTVTRQTYAGPRVVEAAVDIVMPADRIELDYWIDLTP